MKDPHVAALMYRVVADPGVEFRNPPALERETEAFHLRVEAGTASLGMKEHHASVDSARKRVEPYLRAWEIHVGVRTGRPEIRFEFDRPEIIDRARPESASLLEVSAGDLIILGGRADLRITRASYPDPPQRFVSSPDVETMWRRYTGYREGREPLGAMAYLCLSVVEASVGGRVKAAKQYGMSRNVLDELGRLATEVGDAQTIRKFTSKPARPHTSAEVSWIEEAVKALILRLGEWAADSSAQLATLTMNDLPKL